MKSTIKSVTWRRKMLSLAAAFALLCIRTASAADYPTTVLADNPIAYYRFEETSGTVAVDSSSTGLFPATYLYSSDNLYPELGQPGIDTNSMLLSAADPAFAYSGYYDELNEQAPFSWEIWVRPTSVSSTVYRCPLGNWAGFISPTTSRSGWYLYQVPGTPSQWGIYTSDGVYVHASAIPIVAGQWYHVACTYDGTNFSLYVNGTLGQTKPDPGYQANSTGGYYGALLFGALDGSDPGDTAFDGNEDEFAYYTNVLTAAQILNHYQIGTNSFRAAPSAPSIAQDVVSTTNYAGTTVQFSVQAIGTEPLAYQWYEGASAISDATNDTYSFTCALADNGTTYYVQVSNGVGFTNSSTATLTVSTGLQIDAPLTSITRNVGSAAAFEIAAEGALPLSYQWYNGVSPIAGATNQILWLSNVQLTNNGASYYVSVSNPYKSTNSAPATLTVQARAVNAPTNNYARVVMADGPIAYWRLDDASGSTNAVDAVGSFDGGYVVTNGSGGSYVIANGSFTFGLPTGIPNDTDPAVGITNGAFVKIPYSIEINPPGAFTVEGWFQPASVSTGAARDYRTAISSVSNPLGAGLTGWLVYQTSGNTWQWYTYSGYDNENDFDDPDQIVANSWYYLTMVYDGTTFTFYVNGVAEASGPNSTFTQNGNVPSGGAADYNYNYNTTPGLPTGSGSFDIGWRDDLNYNPFVGTIDDVAVYNKALTPQQIQNHFLNTMPATYLTAAMFGNSIVITWPTGTLQSAPNVSGPYTNVGGAPTSPYTNSVNGSSKMFYRVQLQ